MALGHSGAEYDAWLINIGKGDQFGSGFVEINPNSKIPALVITSLSAAVSLFACSNPVRSSSIWRKNSVPSLPTDLRGRAEALNWLFWQMGSAPFVGGGFGHFFA